METLLSRVTCGARDRDLYAVAALFWLTSLLRVALAVARHEVFGAEATLALLCAVVVPWALTSRHAVTGQRRAFTANARNR